MAELKITNQDITKLKVDAIVNAANNALCGGGGVDGAIHRAAGPELLECCRKLGYCNTGYAKITRGFNLPARYIIHAVGPVWEGGEKKESELLYSCYRESLAIAEEYKLTSIAFPAISCGAYRFPIMEACEISLESVKESLIPNGNIEEVIFACFDPQVEKQYKKLIGLLE